MNDQQILDKVKLIGKTLKDITNLTKEWYELIGHDHHKDKDCHFYISTKFSYGQKPKYLVEHYGYILEDISKEFGSYTECLIALKAILEKAIKDEKQYQK